jgi:cytochrome oxidase Cu insertion factor (SCO1/SenC/PrrC family)
VSGDRGDERVAAVATAAEGSPPRRVVALSAAVVAALLILGAAAGFGLGHAGKGPLRSPQSSPAASGGGSNRVLRASDAELMGLTRLGGQRAPGFSLVDQEGRRVSLASLERRAVVLNFFDSECTDVCPLVSEELVDAARDLGPAAADVTFVAVNVDAAHASVADVARFSAEHGLSALPHWYFLTGPPSRLRAVWNAYGEKVQVDPRTKSVLHSSIMDFLAPGGALRYQATPFANERPDGTGWLPAGTLAQWGQGIARYSAAVMGR